MTWRPRTLEPLRPPFGADGRTADVTVDVYTRLLRGYGMGSPMAALRLELETHPVFQYAPLTNIGRAYLLLPGRLSHVYEVRRPGETTASVLALKLWQADGRAVLSIFPRRVVGNRNFGFVLLMGGAVVAVPHFDPGFMWGMLGDVLVDRRYDPLGRARELDVKRPLRDRRRPYAKEVMDALADLRF